jgi:hypothetical protein
MQYVIIHEKSAKYATKIEGLLNLVPSAQGARLEDFVNFVAFDTPCALW